MADVLGQLDDRLAMSDFIGDARFIIPGQSSAALQQVSAQLTIPTLIGKFTDAVGGGLGAIGANQPEAAEKCLLGYVDDRWNEGDVWFDMAVVRPISFTFGNILSTQNETISVYSSYRSQTILLSTVVNNLGAGSTLTGLPDTPFVMGAQSGFSVGLVIDVDGIPVIDDTIDFVFSVSTEEVLVTGQRIFIFPVPPQIPHTEELEFLTDIQESIDGSEHRISTRKYPRQTFNYSLAYDGDDRRFIENLLYDWQDNIFGLPIWTEPSLLTAAATAAELTITVDETSYGDYRVGGLVIVFIDRDNFDVLEIASFTSTTITFASALNNSYAVGTLVYPMRLANAAQRGRGSRGFVNDADLNIKFTVLDNDIGESFASVGPYFIEDPANPDMGDPHPIYGTKAVFDDPNASSGRMSESLLRKQYEIDNLTGKRSFSSPWSRSKRGSVKGFVSHTREELTNIRKVIHAFRGRQISFWLPTFYDEMQLTSLLTNASTTLEIENVGFTTFAVFRAPSRSLLRVVKTDGTILTRTITDSEETSSSLETLTVDESWPEDIQISEVLRIDYVELVRADTDRFQIQHLNAKGDAKISFPVITVFD